MNVAAGSGLICLTVVALLAGGSPGIRPRANPADYPAHVMAVDFAIGAAVVPFADVKKIFIADLNAAGYLVVEVGVFPLNNKEVDLSPNDFSLLSDSDRASVRPVDSDALAASVNRKYEPARPAGNSDVYTTESVTIARGPTFDPATGRQQRQTTEVGIAAGVGIGAPPGSSVPYPSRTAPRTGDIAQELWQKSLPDGKTTVGVSGYLYFPKPSGKAKNGPWQLMRDGQSGRVKLTIR